MRRAAGVAGGGSADEGTGRQDSDRRGRRHVDRPIGRRDARRLRRARHHRRHQRRGRRSGGGAARRQRSVSSATDLTSDAEIAALVAGAAAATGRLDFLVNVACTYLDNGAETSRADWLKAFDVNVVGSVMLMQAARPHLAKNKGAIVNFGSISSRVAQTGRWVYPVCKAAILQLTRNQAMDLAPDGIRVNAVSPGWTWSNIMVQLTHDNRAKTDGVAKPFHLLGPRRRSVRSRRGGRVPAVRQRELHHRHRHPRRRRLYRDGAGARRAGDTAARLTA